MTVHKWSEVKCARLEPEQIQAVAQQAQSELDRLEMNLSELLEKTGLTQEQLVAALDISQSQISRMEYREDHLLSTLRRYVQALGGEIEVIARVNDKQIKLTV